MPLLGAHMSIAGHPHKALFRGREAGCRVIQIFTRFRATWSAKGLTGMEIDTFLKAREETSVAPVAIHGSYLINLASPKTDVRERSFILLLKEMTWAELLHIPYLVLHPGSHLGAGEEEGLRRVIDALDRIHEKTRDFRVKILLETTAGQGTNLGCRFEQLAEVFALTEDRERLGICFDTCHAFASGYDFRTAETYRTLFEKFDMILGLDRLKLFHVNDSKKGLGSSLDRHEHPGEGLIGLDAFGLLLNDPIFSDHPFILETPKDVDENGVDWDTANLKILEGLIKGARNT